MSHHGLLVSKLRDTFFPNLGVRGVMENKVDAVCPCVSLADLCGWDCWRTQLWSLAVSPGGLSCSQVLCSWIRRYLYKALGFPLESRDCHFCLRGCMTIYTSTSWQMWKPKVRPVVRRGWRLCVQGLGCLTCHRSLAGQLAKS